MVAPTVSNQRPSKDELTKGFSTKSDKIRKLAQAGYSRSEIADFLGVRYQFVRNVLVNDQRIGKTAPLQPEPGDRPSLGGQSEPLLDVSRPASLRIERDGGATIPKEFCRALGLKEGDVVVVALEDETIRLTSVPAAVKRAQAMVRRYVPADISLVDELIQERRTDAQDEDDDA